MAVPFLFHTAEAESRLEVGIGLNAGYDSNVMRADTGEDKALDTRFLRVKPSIRWHAAERLTLEYHGEAVGYDEASGENHARHQFRVRLSDGHFYHIESTTTRVHGPRDAVVFSRGRNSWATVLARERRQQWQNRTAFHTLIPLGDFYLRPAASLVYYDLNSRVVVGQIGYDNWVDRYDLQGGADLGFNSGDTGEFYIGWRVGRQFQDTDGDRPSSRSNRYDRLFLGMKLDGNPHVQGSLEGGPSLHRYENPQSVGAPTIDGWHLRTRLGGVLFSDSDHWSAEARLERTVASTGLLSSEVRTFQFQYRKGLENGSQIELQGGARALVYDGRPIKEWIYSGVLRWVLPLGEKTNLELELLHEEGRDRAPPRNPGREFSRTVVGLQLQFSL